MYNDILNSNIDYEKEYLEQRELLKAAKTEIQKARAQKYVLEDLYNEEHLNCKKFAKVLKKYQEKISTDDWDKLISEGNDIWDEEDD